MKDDTDYLADLISYRMAQERGARFGVGGLDLDHLPQYTLSTLVREYVYDDYLTSEQFIALVDRIPDERFMV